MRRAWGGEGPGEEEIPGFVFRNKFKHDSDLNFDRAQKSLKQNSDLIKT